MKRLVFRLSELLLGVWLSWKICYAAGGPGRIARAVGERVYRTSEELTAMVLIFCVIFLLCVALLALELAFSALTAENKKSRGIAVGGLSFLLFLYACLYGYPLLDNHFTTAWLMTGKYTATLAESLLKLAAGVFGAGFHWDGTLAWYAVCACLLVCPFVLLATFLGGRNFWPVLIAAFFPALSWLVAHWCRMRGIEQLGLGLLAAMLTAVFLHYFTDEAQLGSERRQKKKKVLLRVLLDRKKQTAVWLLCGLLWGLTFFSGRIRSFGAVMRLIFSSSIYNYQNKLYALEDLRIAQALALSYVLSLLVRWLLSLVEVENHSRAAGWMNAAYMLLLQIWVLPLLSNFMRRAADGAQGALSGSEVAERLKTPAEEFLYAMEAGQLLPLFLGIAAGCALLFLLFMLTVQLPFVRVTVWFFVWFSVCTYVYCIIGLFYHSALGNTSLLLICYILNRILDRLLTAGNRLREKISAER
ncbi:MAG: hypothetical protein ACTTK0_07290 [Stomatobaculum sp.]